MKSVGNIKYFHKETDYYEDEDGSIFVDPKVFILEGVDGCGKTTMTDTIVKTLKEEEIDNTDIEINSLCLPDKNSYGYSFIRSLLTDEYKNYPTDILQSLNIINQLDAFNKIESKSSKIYKQDDVYSMYIVDRSILSTIVYNKLNGGTLYKEMEKMGDLDIISKYYCSTQISIDELFLILPPLDVVLKHAKERSSNEYNDKEESIKSIYKMYIEESKILTVNQSPITVIDTWDGTLTDSENYTNMINEVIGHIKKFE